MPYIFVHLNSEQRSTYICCCRLLNWTRSNNTIRKKKSTFRNPVFGSHYLQNRLIPTFSSSWKWLCQIKINSLCQNWWLEDNQGLEEFLNAIHYLNFFFQLSTHIPLTPGRCSRENLHWFFIWLRHSTLNLYACLIAAFWYLTSLLKGLIVFSKWSHLGCKTYPRKPSSRLLGLLLSHCTKAQC